MNQLHQQTLLMLQKYQFLHCIFTERKLTLVLMIFEQFFVQMYRNIMRKREATFHWQSDFIDLRKFRNV